MHPHRHLLLLPVSTLTSFSLDQGSLKENMLIDAPFDIHDLPSGTVIKCGTVEIRLTYHCEPCNKVKNIVNPKAISHKRGYLASVLNTGVIRVGDTVEVLGKRFESIPYDIGDRIKWFLAKIETSIPVSKLVEEIGLPKSYCRAIPNILKKRDDIDKQKVTYKKDSL